MNGDTTGGPTGPTGRRRGHLRGVRGEAGRTPDGSTRDDETYETHDDFELGGESVDDNSFSVPDLLATDALLDRLGRHEATGGDLADAVARLLDSYALHADPETAGVRPVELPDLDTHVEQEPAHVPAPRVLLARRRTIQRLGRGTVAAAAVLTLLGGTAAAAATSVSPLGGPGGSVSASIASQLPGWFPDTVFSVFAGSPTERAQREIVQAQAAALAGDSEGAKARLKYLQRQLDDTAVDPQVVQQVQQVLAALEDDDLDSVAGAVPTGSPTGSPTASPSPTGTSLVDVATVTPTASPNTWRVPLQPGRTTGTATSAPSTPSPSTPTAGDPATGGTPPRTSTPVTSSPPPVVQNPPAGGGTGAPSTPVTTDPPVTQTPDPSTGGPTGTPTGNPTDSGTGTPTGTPTDTGTGTPTDGSTPTGETGGTPTSSPTDGSTGGAGGGATGDPGTDPVVTPTLPVVATPTLPVVAEPSPTTGEAPVPGSSTDGASGSGDPAATTDSAVTSGS